MPTLAARTALLLLRPLLIAAQDRQLSEIEVREVIRLCELLSHNLPGRTDFNAAATNLCSSIHSSGLLAHAQTEIAGRLLAKVDELRGMLG